MENMIRVTVEVREGATSRRLAITAPSIVRALELAQVGEPGRTARVLFPIDPDEFFVELTEGGTPDLPDAA